MEVASMTEMMSGVENPDDAMAAAEADGLDFRIYSGNPDTDRLLATYDYTTMRRETPASSLLGRHFA
jgi:hypothetical protein